MLKYDQFNDKLRHSLKKYLKNNLGCNKIYSKLRIQFLTY